MKTSKPLHVIGSIARTLLGITFIFSGIVKAIDPLGTTYKIEDYLKAFGGVFNVFIPAAEVAAWCLITFEFVLGVCLLLNVKTRWTSWLALLMMLCMTPLTLYIAIVNPVTDCGCFGDALVISNWATFGKNIVLLALVIVLLIAKRYIPQTFANAAEWVIGAVALIFVVGFMLYARLHLPIRDFRPYKIGNNLPELMTCPDDAEQDEYQVLLIYEQNGREQTFTLQDYPRGDSTWTFVDQQTRLIKKGYEPPIHDFEIISLDGDDRTDDVLDAERATLIVMYELEKADRKQLKKVVDILQKAEHQDEPCFILTGSGEDTIEKFIEEAQNLNCALSEENFCRTDPVTLKTIVRANPGAIVLENGTVTDKWNLRNR